MSKATDKDFPRGWEWWRRPHGHTKLQWLKKFAAHPFCHYCKVPLTANTATKDHLTPTCRGGSDKIANIVPSCLPCNQRKTWRTEAEFIAVRPMLSTQPRPHAALSLPRPIPSLEERLNEPGLLNKLVNEREQVSWAWRNPAYVQQWRGRG
jgi:hypothetical protein